MTAVATKASANAVLATVEEVNINRLRWHCRRGMLELDMVLARFLEEYIDRLTAPQWQEFERLVTLEDQVLWRRVTDTCATDSDVECLLRSCVVC